MLGNHVCYSKVASRLVTAGSRSAGWPAGRSADNQPPPQKRRRRGRRGSRHHIGNTHSCLLLYYILAEEELLSLLAAEMVSVEINVHDNASIVVIVLKIWWCPLWLLRLLLLLRLHDGENLVKKSG